MGFQNESGAAATAATAQNNNNNASAATDNNNAQFEKDVERILPKEKKEDRELSNDYKFM